MTGKMKGFGYVQYSSVEEAKNACNTLNGSTFEGRPIRLDYSGPKSEGQAGQRGRGGIFYKVFLFFNIFLLNK